MNVASLNRHICEVVIKLQEDVGLKAGGQIDSAERSLAGIVGIVVRRRKRAHKGSHALGIHCRSPWLAVYATQPSSWLGHNLLSLTCKLETCDSYKRWEPKHLW